jgi:hypothetical protein
MIEPYWIGAFPSAVYLGSTNYVPVASDWFGFLAISRAREEFKKREDRKSSEDNSSKQVTAIQREGYPASFDCLSVPALSPGGVFLDQHQIENIIFPPITQPAFSSLHSYDPQQNKNS